MPTERKGQNKDKNNSDGSEINPRLNSINASNVD